MTTIITLSAMKGGVGKTTTATALAAALVRAGKSVVLIDLDGQGNATASTGLEKQPDVYRLLADGAQWEDVLRLAPKTFAGKGALYVLASDIATYDMANVPDVQNVLYKRLRLLREAGPDVVVIDTAPSSTNLHVGCYYASDYVLIPSLCEMDAVDGIAATIEQIERAEAVGGGLPVARVLGIIPTRFAGATKNAKEMYGYIRGRFWQHNVFDMVRENTAWQLARNQERSIYAYKPAGHSDRYNKRRAVEDFRPIADYILDLLESTP